MPTGNVTFSRRSEYFIIVLANIDPNKESKEAVNLLIPGVYCGIAEFVEKTPKSEKQGKKYRGMMSIGWNPHFDNKNKTFVRLSVR